MSIRWRLALIVLCLLLPTLATSWWFIGTAYDNEERALNASARETTRALSMVVERELARRATMARMLADSPLLDAAPEISPQDLRRFYDQASRAFDPGSGWVVLSSRQRQLLNTSRPFGDEMPAASLGDGQRFGFAEDQIVLSSLATGRVSHRLIASVQAPVRRHDAVPLNVGVTIVPSELQQIVDRQKMPEGWTAAILDTQGVLAARRPYPERWVGRSATPDLVRHSQGEAEGVFQGSTLDGVQTVTFYSRSPRYGWTFAIGVPKLQYGGTVRRSLGSLATIGLTLLLASMAVALWMGRRIARPITQLRQQAQMLESGDPVEASRTGLVEVDDVSEALACASRRISQARVDLERQVRDATEETRLTLERLAQNQRLESLGRLTGGVAHDFNNLLAVIGSNAEVLRLKHRNQELPRQLQAIARAVEAGSKLTHHLLRFSRRQAVHPERIRLGEYLAAGVDLLQAAVGSNIVLAVDVEPDVHDVEVDPAEFELVLMNLVLNSRDAMPAGGAVTIAARNVLEAPPELQDRDLVLLSVRDTGTGIDSGIVDSVFEPFFTTKPVGHGTGLGLSLVIGFCTQAGGTAKVLQTSPQGTEIGLFLPAVVGPRFENTAGPGLSSEQPPAGMGGFALLVEDNVELGDATEELLSAAGYRIQRMGNADDAMALIASGIRPDVVLTDVVMPGQLNGIDLAGRLRAMQPPIPTVVMTGYAEQIPLDRDFPVLRKPCPPAALLQALHDAMKGDGHQASSAP